MIKPYFARIVHKKLSFIFSNIYWTFILSWNCSLNINNLNISGKFCLCGERVPDVGLILHVPGDDIPRAVLVVCQRPQSLPHRHHRLHPPLGQPRHPWPLDSATHMVQQNAEGVLESYQRQTKTPCKIV